MRCRICLILVPLLLAAGCAKKEAAGPVRDIGPEARAYYKAHADFFHYATPADLPKDLKWEDGHDVPEFADPDAKPGGTSNTFTIDFPRTLRAIGPDATNGEFPYTNNEMGLIDRDPVTHRYIPGVAKEWAFDKDNRTLYFRIDPDARFADGVPVTADDYFFTFFFFRSKYTNDPWYADYYTKNFSGITRYDDHTIALTAPRPRLELPLYLAIGATPEHFYKELGPDWVSRYQWRSEPGTGPYTILPDDIHKGEYIDVTKVKGWWAANKRFYRHRFNPDRIHVVVIRDVNKALEAFKRGDLDSFVLSTPDYWYSKLPDSDPLVQKGYVAKVTFYNQVPRTPYGLYLNVAMPLLNNIDIRRGIAYSCNFDLVIQKYYRGEYQRLQTFDDDYSQVPFPDLHPLPFSLDEAAKSFAKAGFTRRGPDGVLVNDQGERLSFTITATNGVPSTQDVLTILKQEALKAGLELRIELLDWTTGDKKISEKHHQICYLGFGVGAEDYPRYYDFWDSATANRPNTNNLTNYSDPETDKLIDAYQNCLTMDDVRRIASQLEKRVHDACVFIPALKVPFYRGAYWRWVRYPPDFDLKADSGADDYSRQWLEPKMREETLRARDEGVGFPPDIRVYNAPAHP